MFSSLNTSWRLLALVLLISFHRGFCKNRDEQIRNIAERMFVQKNHAAQKFKTPSSAYLTNDNNLSSENFITFENSEEFIPIKLIEKLPVHHDSGILVFEIKPRPALSKLKSFKTKKRYKPFYQSKRNNEQAAKNNNTYGITIKPLNKPDYTNTGSQEHSDQENHNNQPIITSIEDIMNDETSTDNPKVSNTQEWESEEILKEPDDTLIKHVSDTLISSSKYPEDPKKLVYGNLDNLGITYGNTHERIKYSNFRRSELLKLLQYLLNVDSKVPVIVAIRNARQRKPRNKLNLVYKTFSDSNEESEENNEGKEVFDNMVQEPENYMLKFDSRRYKSSEKVKRRNDEEEDTSKSLKLKSESSSTSEEEYDKNPGNPFTVYNNRYTQNWPWYFELEGNHMNVNPKAPQFKGKEPSGADLFFGRKWWYFNQDDYLPFR